MPTDKTLCECNHQFYLHSGGYRTGCVVALGGEDCPCVEFQEKEKMPEPKIPRSFLQVHTAIREAVQNKNYTPESIAAWAYDVAEIEVTREQRQTIKTLAFAELYGFIPRR